MVLGIRGRTDHYRSPKTDRTTVEYMTSLLISTDTETLYRKCTRYKSLRLRLPPLSFSYNLLSIVFTRGVCEIRRHLNREILDQLWHRLNVFCLKRWWGTRKFGIQTFKSLTMKGCYRNWLFIRKKISPLQVFKTLPLVLTKFQFENWKNLETFGILKSYQVSYNRWPIPSFTLRGLVLF
jgi:hypothetical protein